ncbi:MAG: hypothetical protein AB7G68_15530 [Nitrospiraceae bacterium]
MDITIRKNEHCVIGLPRCDYVFSSTRSCFIAYGFDESNLEMSLLRKILQEKGINLWKLAAALLQVRVRIAQKFVQRSLRRSSVLCC